MNKCYVCIAIVLIVLAHSCSNNTSTVLQLLPSGESGIDFKNTIDTETLDVMRYVNLYNGSGVGIADFNNDGFDDVFFGGNLVSSKLYMNEGKKNGIAFQDRTEAAGVETDRWVNGISIVDINQDGWLDIYCSVSSGSNESERENLLFVNQGTQKKGTVHFQEMAKSYGLNITTHSVQSAFLDYDGDGDLDVFVLSNPPIGYLDADANQISFIKKKGDPQRHDRLYRNDGIGENGHPTFSDVSEVTGIVLEGFSLGIAVNDFNGDGRPDVYVANDYVTDDLLYINNGDGTFTDRLRDYVSHTSYSSMGIDIADINNDGLMDFAVMDMLPEDDEGTKMMYSAANHIGHGLMKKLGYVEQYNRNMLQLNNGRTSSRPKKFSEIARFSGVDKTNWSWSVLMPDLDLDGWRDIFITNGFFKDVNDLDFINYEQPNPFLKQEFDGDAYVKSLEAVDGIHLPNYIYRNKNNLMFENIGSKWGIDQNSFSNGAAYSDLDNDGDLDLVVNNINSEAFVYMNNTQGNTKKGDNFLQIELKAKAPNIDAIGTKIEFETSQGKQVYSHYQTRGYLSSVTYVANFGLAKDSIVREIKVTWPDGTYQVLQNIKANAKLLVEKSTDSTVALAEPVASTLKNDWVPTQATGVNYVHKERDFNDFDIQPLLAFKLSQMGPGLAVGDIDNDQMDDFYVGGTNGSQGALFFQQYNGTFERFTIEDTLWYEDQGALLLDLDNDNDLDAYLVSGGTERGGNSRFYSDRLYINSGNRKFFKSQQNFPRQNGSCAVAADYDRDGLIDIFVGGASKSDAYPLPDHSMLLKNATVDKDSPKMTDKTPETLKSVGVVRSAIWSDYDNDSWPDLLVVGDYMPLTIFKNQKGRLEKIEFPELAERNGMWNSINAVDVDGDGDMDYILGNAGLNSKLRPDKENPVTLYISDFDENGTIDPILTKREKGREILVHLRNDLFKQLISLKKKIRNYKQYAQADVTDIFTDAELNKAQKLSFDYAESVCILNNGKNGFKSIPLPSAAQISPIYGTLINDLNNDGIPDIVAVGNSSSTEVFNGHQDASVGLILIGNGDGTFKPVHSTQTNFYLTGDAKAIARIRASNGSFQIIISRTNDSLQTFKMAKSQNLKTVKLNPFDEKIFIEYKNGKTESREAFYGNGYYSQSSRYIELTKTMNRVSVKNSRKKRRVIFKSDYIEE